MLPVIYVIIISYTYAAKKKTVVQPTKPSSDDDSGVRYNFGAKASLPLIQSIPAEAYNTT